MAGLVPPLHSITSHTAAVRPEEKPSTVKGAAAQTIAARMANSCSERSSPRSFISTATAAVTAAFDRYAPKLLEPMPEAVLVKLDELGFLEAGSEAFCRAVLRLLDGDRPVIAAVKDRDVPFLNAVRAHPAARCFQITEENRDELYEEVLAFMKQQLEERP